MCCCPRLWDVYAGAVFLHRDRPTAGTIVAATLPTGTPAFSRGSDFNFGWAGGPDITIDRRLGDDNGLDVRYFNSDETADLQFMTPGQLHRCWFYRSGKYTFVGHATTNFDSTEINWRHFMGDRVSLLVGFRWVELGDDSLYTINRTVAAGDYNFNNHLYGGQFRRRLEFDKPLQPAATERCGQGRCLWKCG